MSESPLSLDTLTVSIRHTVEELNRSITRLSELGVSTNLKVKTDLNGLPCVEEMTLTFDVKKTGGAV
jgi:hypothetical protein